MKKQRINTKTNQKFLKNTGFPVTIKNFLDQ